MKSITLVYKRWFQRILSIRIINILAISLFTLSATSALDSSSWVLILNKEVSNFLFYFPVFCLNKRRFAPVTILSELIILTRFGDLPIIINYILFCYSHHFSAFFNLFLPRWVHCLFLIHITHVNVLLFLLGIESKTRARLIFEKTVGGISKWIEILDFAFWIDLFFLRGKAIWFTTTHQIQRCLIDHWTTAFWRENVSIAEIRARPFHLPPDLLVFSCDCARWVIWHSGPIVCILIFSLTVLSLRLCHQKHFKIHTARAFSI